MKEESEARKKEEIQDEDEDEDNDEVEEENEGRKNNYKSSDSEKHEMKEGVYFCNDCCRKNCVKCGRKNGKDISVRAHISCNKKCRQNFLCGRCGKKGKDLDYFLGSWCRDCNNHYYGLCYFCLKK